MSKGGRQKVDRRAIAAANGYIRGANREQDQNRCEYHYPDESLTLQDKVLSVYILHLKRIRSSELKAFA
ncbi:hypothetical protein EYZ11_005706 [Aspergillus tanneri]|uniref:Uncharacterized protein n=1 Tax=Aspergillus tanneri TaxID=1220188 RepID=A0A4V3UPE5_9EURO|nr:hypothetical protein EYZ11_005706 [Aspergillus tanneri]